MRSEEPASVASLHPAAVHSVFAAQRAASRQHAWMPCSERRGHLLRLERLLRQHQELLCRTISEDFGHRPRTETLLLELFPSLQALRHARKNLERWVRPERRRVGIWFKPGRAEVRYQPLGVVGIIVPWNYPLYLAIAPLAGALAAGNRVMLKLSELTPRFSDLLANLIAKEFSVDHLHICTGGPDVGREFSRLAFDHLLFTGSTAVGREVMQAAARRLTPLTLELGGKSPVIVTPGFNLVVAARRIVFGKFVNAGQTCIAPDYVLAPKEALEALLTEVRHAARSLYGDVGTSDYASIVNERHYSRLQSLLDDATAQGARIEPLLASAAPPSARRFPPVAVIGATPSMRVLQEEIFGPILPIIGYRTLDEAIEYINERPRPLALYIFDSDRSRADELIARTASGGVTINDTLLHVGQDDLPFGGLGESGFGRYHGVEGFRTFSQVRSIFRQGMFAPTALMYPPYGGRLARRLLAFMCRRPPDLPMESLQ